MTACRNKASRAVTAALVGVLSVGAVPMVAIAQTGGADLMIATDEGVIAEAKVVEAVDQTGHGVTIGDDGVVFDETGYSQFVIPTKIQLSSGETKKIDAWDYELVWMEACASSDSGAVRLGNNEYAKKVTLTWGTFTDPGTYYVAVVDRGASVVNNQDCFVKFTIRDTTLDGAYVCDGSNVDDTSIEYNGDYMTFGDGDLGIVINGAVRKDYTDLKVYAKGHDQHQLSGAKNPGEYYVKFKLDGKQYELPFTVVALDLSTAEVVLGTEPMVADINNAIPDEIQSIGQDAVLTNSSTDPAQGYTCKIGDATIHLDYVSGPSGEGRPDTLPVKEGEYVFKVTSDNQNLVKGEQQITVIRYVEDGVIRYNGRPVSVSTNTDNFDAGLVTTYDLDGDPVAHNITYTKNGVAVDGVNGPGYYEATVTIDSASNGYKVGGSAKICFWVKATQISTAEIYVTYKGETPKTTTVRDVYDGENVMDDIAIRAIDEDDQEVPADQLTVTVTDSKGNKVDSVVEAGIYTVTIGTVENSNYRIATPSGTDQFTIVVYEIGIRYNDTSNWSSNKQAVSAWGNADIRLANTMSFDDAGKDSYVYTGEAVVPTFEYDVTSSMYDYDKIVDWKSLPESAYELEYQKWNNTLDKWEDVEAAVEAGNYRVFVKDSTVEDSYNVWATVWFDITDQKIFADVDNNEWYSEWIYKAASEDFRYMTGYGTSQFFGPTDNIKRGDVCVVLYKMAGLYWGDEGSVDTTPGYNTQFSDVDANTYYARAIQWAAKLGIVSGDDNADTFRPEDAVTREELAKMLTIYAEKTGKNTGVDTDAILSEYEDEDSVSDWARDYVAYLVDQDVMGQDSGLKGNQAISRAEVAAMTVRLQPEGKLTNNDFLR